MSASSAILVISTHQIDLSASFRIHSAEPSHPQGYARRVMPVTSSKMATVGSSRIPESETVETSPMVFAMNAPTATFNQVGNAFQLIRNAELTVIGQVSA